MKKDGIKPIIVMDTSSLMKLAAPIDTSRFSMASTSRNKRWSDLISTLAASDIVDRVVIPDIIAFEAIGQLGERRIDRQVQNRDLAKGLTYEAVSRLVRNSERGAENGLVAREISYAPFLELKAAVESLEDNWSEIWKVVNKFRRSDHGERAIFQYVTEDLKHEGPVLFVSDDGGALGQFCGKTTVQGQPITVLSSLGLVNGVLQSEGMKLELGLRGSVRAADAQADINGFFMGNDSYALEVRGVVDESGVNNTPRFVDLVRSSAKPSEQGTILTEANEIPSQSAKFAKKYGDSPRAGASRRKAPSLSEVADIPDQKTVRFR